MKKLVSACILTLATVFSLAAIVSAEEIKMIGTIAKIELAADGKSANVVLKDSKSGTEIPIIVTDELTLDKFKDKRIVDGDEIRCKFDKQDGKNSSKIFKKTAGC